MQNTSRLSLISLKSLVTEWNRETLIVTEGVTELVTKVALDTIGESSEATLNGYLALISRAQPALAEKISRLQIILSLAHTRSRVEIELALQLTDWEAGPNTNEAKSRIINCYLTGNHDLNLTKLGLTSLPACVKDLPIKELFISDNAFLTLPDLSPTLTHLNCSNNPSLTHLPNIPPTLIHLHCSNNPSLTHIPNIPSNLTRLYCFNNHSLTHLPNLPPSLTHLDCSKNPQIISGPVLQLDSPLRTKIESRLNLTDWEAGPNTNEAKSKIINCCLTGNKTLELTGLALLSLPWCIKTLQIEELFVNKNNLLSLPDLPPSLTFLDCSNNSLLTPFYLPGSLIKLNCFNNPLLQIESEIPLNCPVRANTEHILELTDWEAGPNTHVAKSRIINCYLTGSKALDLSNLDLTSPPRCIKNLYVETLLINHNKFSNLPELPVFLSTLDCSNNPLIGPLTLPPNLVVLYCNNNLSITSFPNLPNTLRHLKCRSNPLFIGFANFLPELISLDCSNNPQLTVLPILPTTLSRLDCSNCPRLRTRPRAPRYCHVTDWGTMYRNVEHVVELDIPKESANEALWCRILMNEVQKRYHGEDYSLVISGYKMWGSEELSQSKITIKPLEGSISLTFIFDDIGHFIRVEGPDGVSLKELKKPENEWNHILNQMADAVLKERGIQLEDSTIRLHPQAIEKFPEMILENLPSFMISTRYLKDNFTPSIGIDTGGITRQFVSELCKALFIGSDEKPAPMRRDHNQMPHFDASQGALYQNFGKLISLILTNTKQSATGIFFNPNFYIFLKKACTAPTPNQLKAEIGKVTLSRRELLPIEISLQNILIWYGDTIIPRDTLITSLESLGITPPSETTWVSLDDIELMKMIEDSVLETYEPFALASKKILEGMTFAAMEILATIPDETISEKIQGVLITAEKLKEAIKIDDGLSLSALEKRNWIIERIESKAGDTEWLSQFVSFITGQPFLPSHLPSNPPIKLKFVDGYGFNAHTCFSMLDVPRDATSKDEFFSDLDLCIQDSAHFTTA